MFTTDKKQVWDKPNTIGPFFGEYRFLSNFWIPKNKCITLDTSVFGLPWGNISSPTVEHLYQACKARNDDEDSFYAVFGSKTPGKAKRAGKNIDVRDDWDDIRLDVMHACITSKFDPTAHPELAELLLATNSHDLVEYNSWGDDTWGADITSHRGANLLGQILMSVRNTLA